MLEKELKRLHRLIANKKIDPKKVNTPVGIEVLENGDYNIKCSIHKVSDPMKSLDLIAKALSKQIDHLICYAIPKLTDEEIRRLTDGTRVLVKIEGNGPIVWQVRWQNNLLGFADLGGKFLGVICPETEIWLHS